MKRIIALMLSLVMLMMAVMPSFAFAEGNPIKIYDSVPITIYTSDGLEAAFRAFVKEVSKEYYSGGYDLNKYYYEASKVKHERDDSGFGWWSKRDDPYSTYQKYKDYERYNIPAIQSMLIAGIQEKADSLKELDVQDYSFGMAVNSNNGHWEVNGKSVLAQEAYNAEVDYAIKQAENDLSLKLINAGIDGAVVIATKGVTPDLCANTMDAITNAAAEALNAYAETKYDKLQAFLQNSYRDLMIQSVIDMYENIENELFSDYTQLYNELQNKKNLSNDEKIMMEQLGILLKAIKSMPKRSLSAEDQQRIVEVATELVDAVGLEKVPALSDKEYTIQIAKRIAKSILINLADAIIKTLNPDMKLEDKFVKDAILSAVDSVWDKVSFFEALDQNGDGVYSTGEILLQAISVLINQDFIKDVFSEAFGYLLKVGAIKSLDAEIEAANKLFNAVLAEYSRNMGHSFSQLMYSKHGSAKKLYFAKSELDIAQRSKDQVVNANERLKKLINKNKLTGIDILIDDLVNVAFDALKLTSAAVGLEDQADGEVFYASLACSMYHTMQSAEMRRASLLQNEYHYLSYLPNIDTADIDLLKNFINRIYAVYEMDMLGHSYYVSLDMGWQYQKTEKFKEAMDEYAALHDAVRKEFGIIGYALSLPGEGIVFCTYLWVGSNKSEYLNAVNKMKDKGGYGWIDYNLAVNVYSEIAKYANRTKIPEQYQLVGK